MPTNKILTCPCEKQGCWRDERNKIPAYCEANIYLDELERSNKEYPKEGVIEIYKASCIVREHNDGMTPRIEEALIYAKEMKLQRIGFAACIAMVNELDLLVKIFTKRGFEVYTACCQIGGADATERGVPEVEGYATGRNICGSANKGGSSPGAPAGSIRGNRYCQQRGYAPGTGAQVLRAG